MISSPSSLDCPLGSFYVNISGTASDFPRGYVPHGNPHLDGEGVFTFHGDKLDWEIHLAQEEYIVTQAHIYNLKKVPSGDSWSCWGGRWSEHAFLQGTDFRDLYGITAKDIRDQTWVLMLHTEGGHFALNDEGKLMVYNAKRHETSVTGTKESGERFNNRVPRKLTDRILRQVNPVSGKRGDPEFDAIYPDPDHFLRTRETPFADEEGNAWIVWDDASERYVPSSHGIQYNLTEDEIDNVEYLFYLYDDAGPEWDWGGPEGAGGGILHPCPEKAAPTAKPITTEPTAPPTDAPTASQNVTSTESPTSTPTASPAASPTATPSAPPNDQATEESAALGATGGTPLDDESELESSTNGISNEHSTDILLESNTVVATEESTKTNSDRSVSTANASDASSLHRWSSSWITCVGVLVSVVLLVTTTTTVMV